LKGWTRRQTVEEALNELAKSLHCNDKDFEQIEAEKTPDKGDQINH
jgi:hypothetical protein